MLVMAPNLLMKSAASGGSLPPADFIYRGFKSGYSDHALFTDLPVLAGGTYLVFSNIDQNGFEFTGGNLEGVSLGTAIATVTRDSLRVSLFEVTIPGGGNQELRVNMNNATSNQTHTLIYIGNGSVAETVTDTELGTPPDLYFSVADNNDGKLIVSDMINKGPSNHLGYSGDFSVIAPNQWFSEYTTGVAVADVTGESPTTGEVFYSNTYSGACGIMAKVT